MQFLAKDNDIKVIECNLRASRSFPFVSKVLKYNFIEMATRIMLGEHVAELNKSVFDLDYVGVKASQFSFARLLKADPVLGVDMSSTGEVGCIGENYYEAILKSMISVGNRIPEKNILISSGPSRSKVELLNSTKMLIAKGYIFLQQQARLSSLRKTVFVSPSFIGPTKRKTEYYGLPAE